MTISAEQLAQYERDGFLIIEEMFSDDDLQPVIDEIAGAVERSVTNDIFGAARVYEDRYIERFGLCPECVVVSAGRNIAVDVTAN